MNASSLFRVEFGRLMRNRLAWLAAALTALAPIAGYSFYHPTFEIPWARSIWRIQC